MPVKIKRFDAAKYIRTPQEEAETVSRALESGDAGYIAAALGAVARARGISEIAAQTGLNRTALYEALSEDGNPTLDTVMKVMCALDLKLEAHHTNDDCPMEMVLQA